MSKELTEQLRNGTLKSGYYYATSFIGWSSGVKEIIYPFFLSNKTRGDIKEVLAPVPSYDESNEFVQKIHILEKQLSSISEQLKEAEDVIRFYANTDGLTEEEKQMTAEKYHLVYGLKAIDYLEKWSVK